MINYLKKNFLSILIGCIIGTPIALYAVSQQQAVHYVQQEVQQVQIETVQIEERNGSDLNINFQVYEMTPDDIALEEYYDSLELLALCVEAEAGNQGLLGKRYVVDVILNRVDDEDFPNTIEEVILQKKQFSVVLDGRIWKMSPTEETFQAIREELENRTNTEVLYFTSEGFHPCGKDWKKIGDHYFSVKKVM